MVTEAALQMDLGMIYGPMDDMDDMGMDQYLLIPFLGDFRGMNIHLPAILMFTRGTRF